MYSRVRIDWDKLQRNHYSIKNIKLYIKLYTFLPYFFPEKVVVQNRERERHGLI